MATPVDMASKPLFIQGADGTWQYGAPDLRALIDVAYFEGVDNPNNDFQVQQKTGGTDMSVDVNGGTAVIQGNSPAGSRKYMVRADSEIAANVPLDPAPASNSRIDLIVAEVLDATTGGGTDRKWRFRVVNGTPAASPAPPAVPSNSIELARVLVAAGTAAITNAMITNRRTCMHRFATYAEVVGAPTTAPTFIRSYTGQLMVGLVTGAIYRGDGSGGWVDLFAGVPVWSGNEGTLFGGAVPAGARRRTVSGVELEDFDAGKGRINWAASGVELSGIVSFTAIARKTGATITLSHRTDGTTSGVQIPLEARIQTAGGNTPADEAFTIIYTVFGW